MAEYGTGVPPLKPTNMLNCTDATNLCYEEYVYRGKWTSRGKADDWILSTQICCRPGGTVAPANIQAGYSYIEAGAGYSYIGAGAGYSYIGAGAGYSYIGAGAGYSYVGAGYGWLYTGDSECSGA